jgi:hypothetical protein
MKRLRAGLQALEQYVTDRIALRRRERVDAERYYDGDGNTARGAVNELTAVLHQVRALLSETKA